jgi:putative holliday junction resolvase
MKVLAVDFGMKRIGFAVGSVLIKTAVPIEPIMRKNSKQVIQYIKQLVDEYEIERIVMGYPLNMDGSKAKMTEHVENFTRRLRRAVGLGIQIDFVDERLSSFEAEEELKSIQPDFKKRKKIIDSMSALVLLRRYMETA